MRRVVLTAGMLAVWAVWACTVSANYIEPSRTVTMPDGKQLACYEQGAAKTLGNSAGYAGLSYPNLVKGGVAEATIGTLSRAAIASSRHVTDFYRSGYNASGDDLPGAPTGPLDCLADYMGTSQDAYSNVNGGTTFWNYTDGTRIYARDIYSYGSSYYDSDGQSLRKQLLKSPLKYGHVTSGFGMRMHPILGYSRRHVRHVRVCQVFRRLQPRRSFDDPRGLQSIHPRI